MVEPSGELPSETGLEESDVVKPLMPIVAGLLEPSVEGLAEPLVKEQAEQSVL